jgi:hypothetical protein
MAELQEASATMALSLPDSLRAAIHRERSKPDSEADLRPSLYCWIPVDGRGEPRKAVEPGLMDRVRAHAPEKSLWTLWGLVFRAQTGLGREEM